MHSGKKCNFFGALSKKFTQKNPQLSNLRAKNCFLSQFWRQKFSILEIGSKILDFNVAPKKVVILKIALFS